MMVLQITVYGVFIMLVLTMLIIAKSIMTSTEKRAGKG